MMQIDSVVPILRSHKRVKFNDGVFYRVLGDIIHELIRDHISNFRIYIPLIMRIYAGLTSAEKTYYLGYFPGRIAEESDYEIAPSLVLKASLENSTFSWGAGKIYECSELVSNTENTPYIVTYNKQMFRSIREICENKYHDSANALSIPLRIHKVGLVHSDLYGFLVLISNNDTFSETDRKIATKVTSYFEAHLNNFEI